MEMILQQNKQHDQTDGVGTLVVAGDGDIDELNRKTRIEECYLQSFFETKLYVNDFERR